MKSVESLNEQQLRELINDLVESGAEVQGCSENYFLNEYHNLKWFDSDSDVTEDDVYKEVQRLVKQYLPQFEDCDEGGEGHDEYFICYIDHETGNTFEILFSMGEELAIMRDICGDVPEIEIVEDFLENIILPKVNAIFQ